MNIPASKWQASRSKKDWQAAQGSGSGSGRQRRRCRQPAERGVARTSSLRTSTLCRYSCSAAAVRPCRGKQRPSDRQEAGEGSNSWVGHPEREIASAAAPLHPPRPRHRPQEADRGHPRARPRFAWFGRDLETARSRDQRTAAMGCAGSESWHLFESMQAGKENRLTASSQQDGTAINRLFTYLGIA